MTAIFCIKITNRQSIIVSTVGSVMVRVTGLEPACLWAYEPESYVSANSTTPADCFIIIARHSSFVNTFFIFFKKMKKRREKTSSRRKKHFIYATFYPLFFSWDWDVCGQNNQNCPLFCPARNIPRGCRTEVPPFPNEACLPRPAVPHPH